MRWSKYLLPTYNNPPPEASPNKVLNSGTSGTTCLAVAHNNTDPKLNIHVPNTEYIILSLFDNACRCFWLYMYSPSPMWALNQIELANTISLSPTTLKI